MKKSKNLLLISYFFPPFNGVASVRMSNIAFYLSKLGWQITIVTPDPKLWAVDRKDEIDLNNKFPNIKFIYTDHKFCFLNHYFKIEGNRTQYFIKGLIRKLSRMVGLDNSIGWKRSVKNIYSEIIKNNYDIILSSGGPFSSFEIAKKLSKKLCIPYVLDYRDGWTCGNPFHKKKILSSFYSLLEKNLLINAECVIAVSLGLKKQLDECFKCGYKTKIITNGFNPIEMTKILPLNFEKPAIVYAGNLYPPHRTLAPIMEALKLIKDKYDKTKWEFHYFGKYSDSVKKNARLYKLTDFVNIHGYVSRVKALEANKGSILSIVITSIVENGDKNINGIITGKIFDLVGLGSRILLISPHGGDAEKILISSGLGKCFNGTEIDEIASYINYCLDNEKEIRKVSSDYSWDNLSKRLDMILKSVINNELN